MDVTFCQDCICISMAKFAVRSYLHCSVIVKFIFYTYAVLIAVRHSAVRTEIFGVFRTEIFGVFRSVMNARIVY
jgi:hypothetical protein